MAESKSRPLNIGDEVVHRDSGWTGTVAAIRDDDTGMKGSQGPLVTVDPVRTPGKVWKAITVTHDELELLNG